MAVHTEGRRSNPGTKLVRSHGALIEQYFAAFNRREPQEMLDLLSDDVVHEPSQGAARTRKRAFAEFLDHMNRCYVETIVEPVIMVSDDGDNAAAEFLVNRVYILTDEGFPRAVDDHYRIRAGAFFHIRDGKIARVGNHYNLADWIAQVS